MQNQYEEIIILKKSADREKALSFIKDIYKHWLPEKNTFVDGLKIKFVANGEYEFGRLSNASLDFGECYDFRDTFVESWHVFYRDEPGENADLTVVHEEWRDKS